MSALREPTLRDLCPQCGKQYRAKACGPTHAIVAAGWVEIGVPPRPIRARSSHPRTRSRARKA
jgi:hypothetical protein